MDGVDVDARGLRCPWPALRLAAALRHKATVSIAVDDPLAPGEIASLAAARGWRLEDRGGGVFDVDAGPR